MEEGETPREGATREVKEETGLDLKLDEKPFYLYFYPNNCECCSELVVHIFKVKLKQEPLLRIDPKEHTKFKWFTKKEIKTLGERATPCVRAVSKII